MDEKLTFEYDRTGDILYVTKVAPYAGQESAELEDAIIVRLNPQTGAIEGLEILDFSRRFQENKLFELPITVVLRLAV